MMIVKTRRLRLEGIKIKYVTNGNPRGVLKFVWQILLVMAASKSKTVPKLKFSFNANPYLNVIGFKD